jgi:hypothetical protein
MLGTPLEEPEGQCRGFVRTFGLGFGGPGALSAGDARLNCDSRDLTLHKGQTDVVWTVRGPSNFNFL